MYVIFHALLTLNTHFVTREHAGLPIYHQLVRNPIRARSWRRVEDARTAADCEIGAVHGVQGVVTLQSQNYYFSDVSNDLNLSRKENYFNLKYMYVRYMYYMSLNWK